MTGPDFDHFCRLVQTRSGLSIGAEKTYLVQSRLEPVARANGISGVPDLLARLRAGAPETLVRRCIDAMATHESLFFRDNTPFQELAGVVLPELARNRPHERPLRIWCAACSSGQEPYSIAMLMQEQGHILGGRRVEIVATDMAEGILEKARAGVYSDFEVRRGLSPERLGRWMTARGGDWEVSAQLKSMVSFRRHNLLDGAAGLGVFDIVFCRNVLIYFDAPRKAQVLEQIAGVTAPDGALFLGSAETIIGLTDAFGLSVGTRAVYRPRGEASKLARTA
jgi:chemotaxis protein methyltransferase CheR